MINLLSDLGQVSRRNETLFGLMKVIWRYCMSNEAR